MRTLRKQMKLIANLVETILQYRLSPSNGLSEHLGEMRKKIRQMTLTQSYEEGISEMLVSKENYGIRNKMGKFENQMQGSNCPQLTIQIQISAIEKCSCQKYNQQLWQFVVKLGKNNHHSRPFQTARSSVQLIQHTLKYLMCYCLLPLNKQHRNRYMIDHKVIISCQDLSVSLTDFGNISSQQLILSQAPDGICRIETNYFFNQRKVQQSLKQIIMCRSLQTSGNSKKNSSDTTDSLKKVSIYQHYDEQLDITVLSGSDFSSQNGEEVEVELQNYIEEEEQFQILIEQTLNGDELLLKSNYSLFKDLSSYENSYF